MPLYEYRCEKGGEELLAVGTMASHPDSLHCDEHDSPASRVFSTQAAYFHPLKSAYFIPPNPKTEAAFIKQEEKRGHDVRKRRIFK